MKKQVEFMNGQLENKKSKNLSAENKFVEGKQADRNYRSKNLSAKREFLGAKGTARKQEKGNLSAKRESRQKKRTARNLIIVNYSCPKSIPDTKPKQIV